MTQSKFQTFRVLVAVGYYLLVAFPLVVSAGQVTLQWDANEQTPDGYNLYQRVEDQGYDYSNPVNEEILTETSVTIDGIEKGVRYYFVVSALVDGEESEDSNEIEYIGMGMGNNVIDDSIAVINGTSSSGDAGSGCFIGICQAEGAAAQRVGSNLIIATLLAIAATALARGRRFSK